jgi:thioredoxin-related protein
MTGLLLAIPIGLAAVVVAAVVQRRTNRHEMTQTGFGVPSQLARADFARPDTPWLVVLFSSATCDSCASAWDKVKHLASDDVAVEDAEAVERKDLHERYKVEAVPTIVVVDGEGAVRASFLGTPTAADLWATVAMLRDPAMELPEGCDLHQP